MPSSSDQGSKEAPTNYWMKANLKNDKVIIVKTSLATNVLQAMAEALEKIKEFGIDPDLIRNFTTVPGPGRYKKVILF